MAVAYTTHNRMLTVALSGDIDHHRVKGLVQDGAGDRRSASPPAHC